MKTSSHDDGFSLIELLIVVAIIGIIASIAIPNMLASRRAANEGSAVSSLRTLHSAQATYVATEGNGRYGTLAQLDGQDLVDSLLGLGTKSGYTFSCEDVNLTLGPPPTYFATAIPRDVDPISRTGNRSFTIAEGGVLRGKITDSAAVDHNEAVNSAQWPPLE
ncbi:MAG TPA: prepilin-type N-terminal cleavage/methylation domain-containing protein [Pyrinomonadaceae bacterium]|nr:prepilin-type N-terminal cleavage/methylation domain-containing protein [Pyrinomonadaceae bacterium]